MLFEESLGALLKLIGILGSEILTGSTEGELLAQRRVVIKVAGQTFGDVFALRDDTHAGLDILQNLGKKDGIMGTAQDDGVDGGILAHEFVNALLDKIIGAGAVGFVILDKGHPERAGYTADTDIGKEFGYFDVVAMAAHGAFGGQQAHVTAMGERADNFGRGADDA